MCVGTKRFFNEIFMYVRLFALFRIFIRYFAIKLIAIWSHSEPFGAFECYLLLEKVRTEILVAGQTDWCQYLLTVAELYERKPPINDDDETD